MELNNTKYCYYLFGKVPHNYTNTNVLMKETMTNEIKIHCYQLGLKSYHVTYVH